MIMMPAPQSRCRRSPYLSPTPVNVLVGKTSLLQTFDCFDDDAFSRHHRCRAASFRFYQHAAPKKCFAILHAAGIYRVYASSRTCYGGMISILPLPATSKLFYSKSTFAARKYAFCWDCFLSYEMVMRLALIISILRRRIHAVVDIASKACRRPPFS